MLTMIDSVDDEVLEPLYMSVIRTIASWSQEADGIGAVVGADPP